MRSRPVHRAIALCALGWVVAGLGDTAKAQVAGGDLHFGTWNFLHSEHERWPEIGGRLRLGRPGARTQLAVEAGAAFDVLFGGTVEALGATVVHEPGPLGRRFWYIGAGYTALWATGGGATGFAHGAEGLIGVHLGRGPESRWSLEGRLVIGPKRERDDGTREPVRYLSVAFARRFGPTSAWRPRQ
jgi:hypothetical protein